MKNKIDFNQFLNDVFNKETKIFNFLRFCMIGVINTIHYYIWYLMLLKAKVPYVISHTAAFTLSMIGSYFLNCYITFKTKPSLGKFIKFPLTTLSNYLISTFSLIILVGIFNINSSVAAILASIFPIPITFMVTQYILKKPDSNVKTKAIFINLFVIIFLLIFSIGCHLYVFYDKKYFGATGMDNAKQFMYFIPFLQKTFLSGSPFWSWSYGLGGDVLGQFSYYYTTSPFFYLMLLLAKLGGGSWSLGDTLKWRLIFGIFKQLLAMSFLYSLLKYEGKRTYTSLIGAVIYGGCINFVYCSFFYDFMTDAYIWLPLTILGWRIYDKTGKWFLFVVSAALTVTNSFYFGFMSGVYYIIFIFIFITIKGGTIKEKIYSFLKSISKYVLFGVLALGLAAAAFIPAVSALLKTDRFSIAVNIPAFYDSSYILGIFEKLFFYSGNLGFPLIALIVFTLPWKQISLDTKKKTILSCIFFALYLIPYTGSFFNGFSYPSNRWFYLFIFTIAYSLPDWLEENDKLKSFGFYLFSIIAIIAVFFFYTKAIRGFNYTVGSIKTTKVINRLILASGIMSFFTVALKKYISINRILNSILVLCIATGLILNANAFFNIYKPNITGETLKNSCMDNIEEKQIFNELAPASNEFYRIIFRSLYEENAPLNYNYYGTSAYNSMIDGNLHRWLKVDYNILNPYVSPSRYKNFDDRLFLETVFSGKYIVKYKNDSYIPSYPYKLNKKTENYYIYENPYSVGFDLWYTNTTSIQEYKNMNIAKKDAILLQTAMIDKNIPGLNNSSPDDITTELRLDWGRAVTENMEYKDGFITAGKKAYIIIPLGNKRKNTDGEILFSMNLKPIAGQKINLSVNGKSTTKLEENYPYAYPINDFTFKLDGNTNEIRIDISEGKYILSNAHAWFNSYKYYKSWVNERNKHNLENIYINGGKVKGTIKNNENGILALNIPFSKGWTAKVNGKKQELIRINGVLTGLVLEPGEYNIELTYITPGFILGASISIIFFTALIACYILRRIFFKRKD